MLMETTTAMPPVRVTDASDDEDRYARCIAISKRVRWDIDKDVIRGRSFNPSDKFLPDGLSLVQDMDFLTGDEKRFISQVQGRTYANIFGLVERFITAKLLEVGREYSLGNQNALEALVRFSDEELKHQALFRRINDMMSEIMPAGYRFDIDPDMVARAVLSKSTWAVLVLTLHIELFVQNHYRQSIDPEADLSGLFKDVFLYHWKDECQHVVLDELEVARRDATLTPEQRDIAVEDFIGLVGAVDGILQMQAAADANYAMSIMMMHGRSFTDDEKQAMEQSMLKAYRWQYILSGAQHPHFVKVLTGLTTDAQRGRIQAAVASLM